jgi:hypothetical protein
LSETGYPSGSDGRNIDAAAGALQGEAAQQAGPHRRRPPEGAPPAWEQRPTEAYARGYYDRPVLKEPAWIWAVPVYFYVGGAAGAAAVFGQVLEFIDRDRYRRLSKRCRVISVLGTSIGGGLLIYDLGRPERFLNMLRVFRPTSALNMGSWVLAAAGMFGSLSLIFENSRIVKAGAVLAGLPESGYTAVLLSDTAVPLWQATRRSLPSLFVASAASSAAGLLESAGLEPQERRAVQVFGTAARIAELLAGRAVEKEARAVARVARPLQEGLSGSLWRASKTGTIASAGISLLPGEGRIKLAAGGLLGIGSGLSMRFAMFYAGRASALDPRATFEQQRAGRGAAELRP